MSKLSSLSENWWFLYPVTGLSLLDDSHDLEQPMLGDATILSTQHVDQIMALIGANAPKQFNIHNYEAALRRILTPVEPSDSWVAVQWAGSLPKEAEQQAVFETKARAYQIVAAMA